ncbi:hypothetical protein EVAR_68272_1 [Eumeta japonica]|uniref:Uncharacterized protein n=1 Tax=Eumeta variegata TaxID=151549 RepID=A0A4C1SLE8_EUMVA|nr:hypothetical protein EVAR_68272_1 [Eumeta japonica]
MVTNISSYIIVHVVHSTAHEKLNDHNVDLHVRSSRNTQLICRERPSLKHRRRVQRSSRSLTVPYKNITTPLSARERFVRLTRQLRRAHGHGISNDITDFDPV